MKLVKPLAALAAMFAAAAATAGVSNLESYYIRHDFSKGSNNCILSGESGAKDVIGNSLGATEGPNGADNAVRISNDPWDELDYDALNSGWTLAACLRVGDTTDNGVIVSVGRLYGTSTKRRALVICSSSDPGKLYVRVVRRNSGNYYTDVNITLSDLGDVTAAFHTIAVTCSGNNLAVYWDGEKKATATMTSGYTFGASDKLPGWQFNKLVTRGNLSTGGYTYKTSGVKAALHDVRLYTNGKVFDDDDAAAYVALYPCTTPFRPNAYIEASGSNTVGKIGNYIDTGYAAKGNKTRFTADFQFLDTTGTQYLFGMTDVLKPYFYINNGNNFAWNMHDTGWESTLKSADRARRIVVIDGENRTVAITNRIDGSELFSDGSTRKENANDDEASVNLFATINDTDVNGKGFAKARIYSFEIDEAGVPVHFFAPATQNGVAGMKDVIAGTFHGDANVPSAERELRFYDGVGCADDYKYENGVLYAKLYASSEADGTVKVGDGEAGATAEGWVPHGGAATLAATPASRHIFARWVGDTWAIAGGDATARQIQVRASCAVQLRAEYASAVPVYAKLDGDGKWRFFNDEMIPLNEEEGEDDLEPGVKVLFSSDAELKTLASQHGEEIAAAGATYCLENDITLTADTDWRAFDFDMNGKTVTLAGYDLQVGKPQGVGRFTAGNLIANGDFENGTAGWTLGSQYERATASGYGVTADTCKDRPFAGNHWCVIGTANDKAGATAHFTAPKDGECYIRFRFAKYDSNYNEYKVNCGIDEVNNVAYRVNVKPYPSGTSSDIYRKTLTAGDHTFIFGRYYAHILVDEATVSPTSHLTFDIPEGEEYGNANIVLGSTQDWFFDGMGLVVRKAGAGRMTLSNANCRYGAAGATTLFVDGGTLENPSASSAGAGNIAVAAGATLSLSGQTLSLAGRVLEVGGTLACANGGISEIATLAFGGNSAFNGEGTVQTTVVSGRYAAPAAGEPPVQLGKSGATAVTLDLSNRDAAVSGLSFFAGATVAVIPSGAVLGATVVGRRSLLVGWSAMPEDVEFALPDGENYARHALWSKPDGGLYLMRSGKSMMIYIR